MPNNKDDSAKIARIDQKVISLEDWTREHAKDDDDRFNRMFGFMKERFDKVDSKLETLWDSRNRQEGVFGVGKFIAGAVGGFLVAVLDYFHR